MDKRFIEDTFPVKEVSKEAAKEKNVRHGHISTLHLWWARRPLASSRATNYAALIPSLDDEIDLTKKRNFIIELAKWDNSLDKNLTEKAKNDILKSNNGRPPKILDPFTGGGAIPLEALRLGCETYAMDYNPVAVLIEKCTLEYPLIYGVSKENDQWSENNQLSKDVEKWSRWVYNAVKSEIGEYYPKENGSVPVGYIWARTIPCQNPTCDSEIPLMRQFWLSKKTGQNIVLKPSVKNIEIHFEIADFDKLSDFNPNTGTVSRAIVECPVCKSKIDGDTTRKLFQDGKSGEKLVAVILNEKNKKGKIYRIATIKDKEIFENSKKQLNIKIKSFLEKWGMDPIPNEEIPIVHTITQRPFAPRENYGFMEWGDLFNPRQQLSLITFMDKIKEAHNEMLYEGVLKDYAKVLALT